MAEQNAQPPAENEDEDAAWRRLKAQRLRDMEQNRDKQNEEQERIRRAQADGSDPFADLRARAALQPDTAFSPEAKAERAQAERDAGVADVEVGPPPANAAEVAARRRIPVAALALIPVLGFLALPILLGKPSVLRAPDGRGGYGADGHLYVAAEVEKGSLQAPVLWSAPPFTFLRVSGAQRDGYNNAAIVTCPDTGNETPAQHVAVAGLMGPSVSADVVPVPVRPGASLLIGGASPGGKDGEFVLYVGPHGARIALTNDDTTEKAQPLPVFVLVHPDEKNFTIADPSGTGNKLEEKIVARPGEPCVLPITASQGGVLEDRLVLMAGDVHHPLITILLRRSDKDVGEQAVDALLAGDTEGALTLAAGQTRDPAALAVRAYILKSRQKPISPEKDARTANLALASAVESLTLFPTASDRARALTRRAMAIEAIRQNKQDKAAQYRAESNSISPEIARLP